MTQIASHLILAGDHIRLSDGSEHVAREAAVTSASGKTVTVDLGGEKPRRFNFTTLVEVLHSREDIDALHVEAIDANMEREFHILRSNLEMYEELSWDAGAVRGRKLMLNNGYSEAEVSTIEHAYYNTLHGQQQYHILEYVPQGAPWDW